jgi:hypothetical protein
LFNVKKITDITTEYNPSVFHRELQKNYGFCHIHRRITDGLPMAFPTLIPTESNPSVFHRELQKNYGILPQSPTDYRRITDDFSDATPDGITDGLSNACLTRVRLHVYRRHYRRLIPTALPMDNACMPRVCLHAFRRNSRQSIPTALLTNHACLTRVRLHEYRRNCRWNEKVWQDF